MSTKSISERKNKYFEIYRKEISPTLNEYEKERINTLRIFNIKSSLLYILVPLFIMGIQILIFGGMRWEWPYMVLCVFMLIFLAVPILLFLYFSARKEEKRIFANMMKVNILQKLLKIFGNIEWKSHNDSIVNPGDEILTDSELNKSGLFISYNTRYTDDEFEGSYKDVKFKISETKMFDIQNSSKNRTTICAFRGVVISFDCNKKIKNRTIVATKGDLTKKNQALVATLVAIPIVINFFIIGGYSHLKLILALITLAVVFIIAKMSESNEEPLNKVLLEDPEFTKRFDIYSSDQIEARYLVTTSFMQRFYDLNTAFGAKNAKCSFYNDKLMIAINTKKNLFEVCNLYKSMLDPSSIDNFYNELDSIYQMIDYFKLDEKTGL